MRRNLAALVTLVAGVALILSSSHQQDGRVGAPLPSLRPSDTVSIADPITLHLHKVPTVHVYPVRPEVLVLPTLGVSATVSAVSQDSSGALTPPSDYTTVGWWAAGAKPGSKRGTAIIAGHTVHTGGGALDNLGKVEVGDPVRIRGSHRLLLHVDSVATYSKGSIAAHATRIFRQDGNPRVAIVTCGDWNGSIYLSNIVVLAS